MTAVSAPGATELPPMDRAGRLARVRAEMASAGCEALLVTNPVNIRYLVGFTGSAGLLLVAADDCLLATDGRYRSQAGEEVGAAGVDARVEIGGRAQLQEVVSTTAGGLSRIGLEAGHVTWARQRVFASTWFPGSELVATEGLVEGRRQVKDEGEIARVAAAARIADKALQEVKAGLAPGVTEAEVALTLDTEMRRLGSSGSAFETIVASGPNSAKPHARPSGRALEEGDLLVLDFGAVVDGYRSDMTRTLCLGQPSGSMRRVVEVVTESQRAGVEVVGPGRGAAEVDEACRTVIAEAGWADAFVHGTGHGVGLDIHEAPALAATSGDVLAVGHVVTVEPGVYLPSRGGARVEDTVVVTDHGCRLLTRAPKELLI